MIVGTAEVELRPNSQRFSSRAQSEMSSGLGVAGERSGRSFGQRFNGTLGRTLKRGVKFTAAGIAGVLGASVFKGFNRLRAIEDAEAKLTGLGHSAQTVETIMGNALASVKGTAFGLDEAASLAAGAVAAGIKPGRELERVLKLTGDAATIAGSSLSEMGLIFGKVAASNKVQGDVVNQLNERGVPILQLLGKELGKSAAEVSKLVTKGEVDFPTFANAMEKGLGGAALKSGETTTGAFKNMGAALGRFGAQLLTGVYPLAKVVFGGITRLLDRLAAKVAPLAEAFSQRLVDGVAAAAVVFARVRTAAQGLFDLFVRGDFTSAFRDAFGVEEDAPIVDVLFRIRDAVIVVSGFIQRNIVPIAAGLAAMATPAILSGLASLATTIGAGLIAALTPLAGAAIPLFVLGAAIAQVIKESKPLRDAIGGIAAAFRTGGIEGAIEQVGVALSMAVPLIAAKLLEWGQAIVDWVTPRIPPLLAKLAELYAAVGTWITSVALPAIVAQLELWGQALVDWISPRIRPALEKLVELVTALYEWIGSTGGPLLLEQLGVMGQALVDWIEPRIGPAVGELAKFIGRAAAWILGTGLPRLTVALVKMSQALLEWVAPRIPGLLVELGKLAKAVTEAMFLSGIEAIKGFVSGFTDTDIGGALSSVRDKVVGFFAGASGWLVSAGKDVIQGLANGILSMRSVAEAALFAVVGPLAPAANSILGNRSPSRVFKQIGRYVGQGLILGLLGTRDKVRSTMQGLARAVVDTFTDLGDTRRTLTRRIEDLTDRLRGLDRASRTYARDRRRIVEDLRAAESQLSAANRFTRGTRDALLDRVRAVNARLLPLVRERDQVAARLKRATDALNDAVKVRADFASGLTEQLRGAFGIVANDGIVSAGRIEKQMRDRLGALTRFQAQLATLVKRGLSPELIRQIAESGVEAGTATASALANASAAEIKRINGLQTQVEKVTASTSKLVADRLYNAGIASARGLVDGLAREQKRVEAQMLKIAKSMETAIKRALGIRSPSTLFRDIGRQTMAGLDQGVVDGSASPVRHMTDTARQLAAALDLSPMLAGPGGAAAGAPVDRSSHLHLSTRVSAGEVMPMWRQFTDLSDALYGTG